MDYSALLSETGIAIFLFHGVIPERINTVRNYTAKHLVYERFLEVLDSLCSNGMPVSIPDIAAAQTEGKELPARSFAITFDDGFENNFSIAVPVLKRKGIPATFYVTTNFIESNASSWTDMIEYAIEISMDFTLDLPFAGPHTLYSTPQQKLDLLHAARTFVKGNRDLDPYHFALDLWRQLRVTTMKSDRYLDEKMTWTQVRELSTDRLFTIGGHGHSHRILEYLEQSELQHEITLSLEMLKASLGFAVEHYSYPEGLLHCYSDRVITVLRSSGIICAPSAMPGINRAGEDLFHLKRIMVTQ